MAQAYGSRENPANLGPFSRIVEVHWSGTFLLVTLEFKVTATAHGERGTGPGPALVEPFSEAFTTLATPEYAVTPPKVEEVSGGSFTVIPPDQVSVSGIPDAPAPTSFDDWKVNGVESGGNHTPFIRWLAPTGGHPDISLPSKNSWFTDLTAPGELAAQEFISSPQPLPVGGDVPLWATFNPTPAQQNTFGLDVHGLSATFNERSYAPIALRVVGQTETNTGLLQVLMKRQTVTS